MTTIHTLILATLLPTLAASQQSSAPAQSRAQQLAAAFNKHKHVVGEKRGVRREKYKDVQSEPVVRRDITAYSGVYRVADLGDVIDLRIESDGRVRATGTDATHPARTFTLENGRIADAVLTATKVYRDGATERFEGVFITRTVRETPNDPGVTVSGLGVLLTTPREFHGNTYDKLFYSLQQ